MSDFTKWVEKNKGLWTRVYDEVIAPDLEKEWVKRKNFMLHHALSQKLMTHQEKKNTRMS